MHSRNPSFREVTLCSFLYTKSLSHPIPLADQALELPPSSLCFLPLLLSTPFPSLTSCVPSSRSLNFWILPDAVLGYVSVKNTYLGTVNMHVSTYGM
jgi:hypothetical protein